LTNIKSGLKFRAHCIQTFQSDTLTVSVSNNFRWSDQLTGWNPFHKNQALYWKPIFIEKNAPMFRNYFTVAFRNLRRNKVFSLINIFGLSVGICASLVIFLIVYFEISYDRFVPDNDRVYRIVLDAQFGGTPGHSASVPAPLGEAINKELTGVESTIPVYGFPGDGSPNVSLTENKSEKKSVFKHRQNIVFTNAQYFHLIPYQWLIGSAEPALQKAFTVVLTESRAHEYFPAIPLNGVIGKEVIYNNDLRLSVSGVVKDLNENSSFGAKEFISIPTIMNTDLKNQLMMGVWNDWMAYSQLFVKLSEGTSRQSFETRLKNLYIKYSGQKANDPNNSIQLVLQPLSDVHFNSNYAAFGQRLASYTSLYGLLAVASFLLILACINFVNLSTAQASQRAKEIGIRKTMGSSRSQLITQFLSETFFITTMATLLSIGLTPFLFKAFVQFIPEGLELNFHRQPLIIPFLILLTLLMSFLSGMYPAMVLSGFNPVKTLKSQAIFSTGQVRSAWVRKSLTVSQFVVAQFFIIATLIVSKQIHFSLNKDLGFRKDAIINFDTPFDSIPNHKDKLLNELNAIPEIERVSTGFLSPASTGVSFTNIKYAGKEDLKAEVQLRWGDSNYLKVYDIQLLAGRNVQKTDSFQEFLINETYSKLLGFNRPQDALGQPLIFNGKNMPIVGVMKDFNQLSTHSPIGPLVLAGGKGSTFHVLLKPKDTDGKNWPTAIAKIQVLFQKMYPETDFSYAFVDDNLAQMYSTEQKTSQLLYWATALTIFISCLGLLGMVIYVTNIRTKEIGVRKILGAPVAHIVFILSKNFIFLVLLGFFIAAPIAWWASNQWLAGFAYRTSLNGWVFLLGAIIILLFALITLSVQTLRTAYANPVKSLRSE
jgi:putative ABC transport system permease protein